MRRSRRSARSERVVRGTRAIASNSEGIHDFTGLCEARHSTARAKPGPTRPERFAADRLGCLREQREEHRHPSTCKPHASRTQSRSLSACGESSIVRTMSCGQGLPGIGSDERMIPR